MPSVVTPPPEKPLQTHSSYQDSQQEHNTAVEIITNEEQLDLSGKDMMACPCVNNMT